MATCSRCGGESRASVRPAAMQQCKGGCRKMVPWGEACEECCALLGLCPSCQQPLQKEGERETGRITDEEIKETILRLARRDPTSPTRILRGWEDLRTRIKEEGLPDPGSFDISLLDREGE